MNLCCNWGVLGKFTKYQYLPGMKWSDMSIFWLVVGREEKSEGHAHIHGAAH
jgi:hypothetical protein